MEHLLIDSDVILDTLLDRKPFSKISTEILTLCANNKVKGYITPVIIANIYYILRKTYSKNEVKQGLNNLLEVVDVVEINKKIIFEALNSDFADFEDALQNFSAVANGKVTAIITRNVKDYQKSNLAVFTPEMYLKSHTN